MTLAFETPSCYDSVLSRWDPRWKVAALGLATLVTAWLRTAPMAAIAFTAGLCLTVMARIPLRWYLQRIAPIAILVGLFVVWVPFVAHREGPYLTVGPIWLSVPGLYVAAALLLKALTVVTLMIVVWVSSPVPDTLKAAHRLHVPGLVIQLFALTYRYLFLIAEELARLRTALRVRGYKPRANAHSFRTAGHVAGTLLVRSYERAERVGHAMRCRGFDGQYRSLASFHTRMSDVAGFTAIIAAAGGLAVWDWILRG